MRANVDQKTMDMEARDINYIMPAYVRSYMYVSKNEDPVEIIFPMFESCPHPYKPGVSIPIRYVPALSPEALEITVNGQDVPEAKVEEEPVVEVMEPREEPVEVGNHIEEEKIAEADMAAKEAAKEATAQDIDPEYEAAKADLTPAPEDVIRLLEEEQSPEEPSPETAYNIGTDHALEPPPGRIPKQPEHPATGSPDGMQSRDARADSQIAKDLVTGDNLDESVDQAPYEKTITRGENGEPKVEE